MNERKDERTKERTDELHEERATAQTKQTHSYITTERHNEGKEDIHTKEIKQKPNEIQN